MYRQNLFQRVIGVTLVIILIGCSSPATKPKLLIDTLIPSTATSVQSSLTPTLITLTQTSLPPSMTIQDGNSLPRTRLQAKPSRKLVDNRIGGTAETQHIGPWVWNAGAKWMRVIVDPYGRWQYTNWDKDEYAIDPQEEKAIDDLVNNGVKVMIVLDVWHPENKVVYYKTDKHIKAYLNWVKFLVHHFQGRIEYYEILNEPDLSFEQPSGMPVDAYVNLVKRTIPIIQEEDPKAKIVVGAVPDTRFDGARDWIWGLLKSDVMPLVDGLSWHGMYGAAPSNDPRGVRDVGAPQMANYWENYPSFVKEIKSTAKANGFDGEFLVEEMLWRTPDTPHESEPYGFTDVSGAKYYARAIIIHLGLDVAAGLAIVREDDRPRSNSVIRNLCSIMAGAQPIELPIMIESDTSNIKYYWFSQTNGDFLVVLWKDDTAVDVDPGIASTITVPGFSNWRAMGLDVLNGFEQELIVSNANGNLIIRDFLIKDYPIIIHLSK
jgi:hypothetical protein